MLPTCVMVSTVWSINFRIVSTALLVFGILIDQMSYQAAAIDCIHETSINPCELVWKGNNTKQHRFKWFKYADVSPPPAKKKTGSEPDSAVVILFYFVLFYFEGTHFILLNSRVYGRQLQLATEWAGFFLHIHVGFIIQPWKWLLLLCGTNHRL